MTEGLLALFENICDCLWQKEKQSHVRNRSLILDMYQRKQEQGWQKPGRAGNLTSPQKFLNQDFVDLRDHCLSRGILFEDDTFPANISSIGPSLKSEFELHKIQWMRPRDILKKPKLIVDDVSRFDILQGKIGDCWLLAALGSLTQQKRFLDNVVPRDQDFEHNYAGIFHFRFWHFGEWMDVVIDDRLPVLNGSYFSVHPRSSNEFWPCLLEKAYAKLRGSYQKLHWGYISESLVDFTGGIQISFLIKKHHSNLYEIIAAAVKSRCLIACTTPGEQTIGNPQLENGLVSGHAYTVTWAEEVPYRGRNERLLRIWNPWGQGEWRGPWSDGSMEWNEIPIEYKNSLHRISNDGEFWLSYQDFIANFSYVCICNDVPTFLDYEEYGNAAWSLDMHVGQWPHGFSARGTSGIFLRTAQYSIQVPEPDLKIDNVVVSLMQKPPNNANNSQLQPIGFRILRGEAKPQEPNFPLTAEQETSYFFNLSPGIYTLILATSNKGQESEFLLRIFQKNQSNNSFAGFFCKAVGATFGYTEPAVPETLIGKSQIIIREPDTKRNPVVPTIQDMPRWNHDNSYEDVFQRYANQRSYLDASQLQKILNDVFLKDLMVGGGRGDRFSFDSCRSLLALMDFYDNGKLLLEEFQRLWRYLNKYKETFRWADENKSGFLDISGLKRVVQMAGLSVDEKLLQLMAVRYGDSSMRFSFPDFACCMIRLDIMEKAFHNLSGSGRQISFSENQFKHKSTLKWPEYMEKNLPYVESLCQTKEAAILGSTPSLKEFILYKLGMPPGSLPWPLPVAGRWTPAPAAAGDQRLTLHAGAGATNTGMRLPDTGAVGPCAGVGHRQPPKAFGRSRQCKSGMRC
uniref:calpain-13 n=1 Tax=Euleptes europaea TaxID=460621 RepID=UPI002540255B|nr:calpain-13 [Euleptes europaea]